LLELPSALLGYFFRTTSFEREESHSSSGKRMIVLAGENA
jgi:hypothetical protein